MDSPVHPHRGRNIFIGGDIAGLGGNVAFVRPVMSYTRWTPMKGLKPNRDGRNSLRHPRPGFVHHRVRRTRGAAL